MNNFSYYLWQAKHIFLGPSSGETVFVQTEPSSNTLSDLSPEALSHTSFGCQPAHLCLLSVLLSYTLNLSLVLKETFYCHWRAFYSASMGSSRLDWCKCLSSWYPLSPVSSVADHGSVTLSGHLIYGGSSTSSALFLPAFFFLSLLRCYFKREFQGMDRLKTLYFFTVILPDSVCSRLSFSWIKL